MPLSLTDKIVALLCSLTDDQVEALPPAERRRLEDQCLRVAVLCTPLPRGIVAEPLCESLFERSENLLTLRRSASERGEGRDDE